MGLLGIVGFFIVFAFFFLRNRNDSVKVDGQVYDFVIYNTTTPPISFSRADKHPKILENYPWLGAASLSYGADFMSEMKEQQLNRYFERPPENLEKNVSKMVSGTNFSGEITAVCVEKYLIGKEWYLFVGMKRSDFPNGVKYSTFVKWNNRWVFPDSHTDPDGNLVQLIGKLNQEVHNESNHVTYKVRPLSRL